MLQVIDSLPEQEREAFDLVRIQGLSSAEALGDLRPDENVSAPN